ncbi:unnamed protein product [Rhizophagus irregularis]|nr:unnamed protein product [Rhizophagus irregularis]
MKSSYLRWRLPMTFIGTGRLGIRRIGRFQYSNNFSTHINICKYVYIFLFALEASNKNLLALEGLELEELEDSNSFQSSNAHQCMLLGTFCNS